MSLNHHRGSCSAVAPSLPLMQIATVPAANATRATISGPTESHKEALCHRADDYPHGCSAAAGRLLGALPSANRPCFGPPLIAEFGLATRGTFRAAGRSSR